MLLYLFPTTTLSLKKGGGGRIPQNKNLFNYNISHLRWFISDT